LSADRKGKKRGKIDDLNSILRKPKEKAKKGEKKRGERGERTATQRAQVLCLPGIARKKKKKGARNNVRRRKGRRGEKKDCPLLLDLWGKRGKRCLPLPSRGQMGGEKKIDSWPLTEEKKGGTHS